MKNSLILFVGLTFTAHLYGQTRELPSRWVGSWATAPFAVPLATPQPVGDVTYRELIHVSQGGDRVRVVLSNEFGTTPLIIDSVYVASSEGESRIAADSQKPLTFSGRTEANIPPGARLVSDPVAFKVEPLSTLAISFYVPSQSLPVLSIHHLALQTNYAEKGNLADAQMLSGAKEITNYPFLRTAEVEPQVPTDAIACLGDSITDGRQSTLNSNARWPNILADRLIREAHERSPSVLNLGIGGNRLLEDGTGPDALARFGRDVLSQSHLKYLIVLEGINDIGEGWGGQRQNANPPTAADLIAAYRQLIRRAHAHNVVVYGATLLPYEGAAYYSDKGEKIREQVNQWIRTSGEFDAVLDFDKVVRDPGHPTQLDPQYASPDHLHPNDAGYRAIGESIPLRLFLSDY